jgi:hypothetical protein
MNKHIIYDGMKWSLSSGYFRGYSRKNNKVLLHRYIWKKYNGPIPKGMWVHHKDENKLNNDINNLQLISPSEHCSLHRKNKKWTKEQRKQLTGNKHALGCKRSKETREKIRIGHLGMKENPNVTRKRQKWLKTHWRNKYTSYDIQNSTGQLAL